MAFQPVPRSQAATPAAGTGGAAATGGRLLLPSQELPVTFALLWEQQVDAGEGNCRELLVRVAKMDCHVPVLDWSWPFTVAVRALQRHALSPAAGMGAESLEGHLATDTNGDLLLCLLSKAAQRLTALRLAPPATAAAAPLAAGRRIEVAFTLPALAAAAVRATLHAGSTERQAGSASSNGRPVPPRDLLLLQPDGRVALYAGRRRLCTVRVAGEGGAPAPYAQLLRLGGAGAPDAAAAHDARFASNHSELSGSKRPPSAGQLGVGGVGGCAAEGALQVTPTSGQRAMLLHCMLHCVARHNGTVPPLGPPHPPTPAAEVRSEDAGGETDEDGDMMLVSPAPRASRLGMPPGGVGGADPLPDVRSLAEALEAPPAVAGLQVHW